MLAHLMDLVARLGHWSYLVIFAVAAAESAAFLGLAVPGESVVIVSGFLAGQGVFHLDALILTVAAGAVLGDNIGYELGRRLGRPWLVRYGGRLGVDEQRLQRGEAFFVRHGGKAVFLGRFVGFARAVVPFVAGSVRMRYAAFFFYNLLGAAGWSTVTVLLGFFVGQLAEAWIGKASAVIGGIAVVAIALVVIRRWLLQHEQQVQAYWAGFNRWPWISALGRWLRRRLSPASYFGLELTLGVVVLVGAAWLFGGITEDVATGDPLTAFDRTAAAWFASHQDPAVTAGMAVISRLATWPLALVGIGFLTFLLCRRSWRWITIALCTVPGGLAVNTLVKLAVHRVRPSYSGIAAVLHSYSFPSGHTIAATLVYGLLAVYGISRARTWWGKVTIAHLAFFMIALVAFSRVYLGLHYVSDVIAATAEGIAWLSLCHIAVTTLWLRTRRG